MGLGGCVPQLPWVAGWAAVSEGRVRAMQGRVRAWEEVTEGMAMKVWCWVVVLGGIRFWLLFISVL